MPNTIEIKQKTIQGAQDGPHLLITGGVHGDEFEPMAAARRLIREVQPESLSGRLTIVPVVNEAAFERQHRWADDGLDLARTFPGGPDGSVTQRTAHAMAPLINEADFYIDLHTGGTTMTVSPMSGYMLHPDKQVLDHQRAMARAFNLPIVWGTTAHLDGRSMSVARDANVPAMYTEHLGGARMDPQGVIDYVDGCLNVMAHLGMIDRPQPPSRVKHVVEDDRENAGFMQLQNPTPVAGFYEPAVELGQTIKAGDTIGAVSDVLGDHVHTVLSTQDGIVLTLKTFCRVNEGDSVAVILETNR